MNWTRAVVAGSCERVARQRWLAAGLICLLAGCTESAKLQVPIHQTRAASSAAVLERAMTDIQNPELHNRIFSAKTEQQLNQESQRAAMRMRARHQNQPADETQADAGFADYWKVVETKNTYLQFNNPATLNSVVDRLNQWLREQPKPTGDWKPDPLIQSLPDEIRNSGVVYGSLNQLDKLTFDRESEFWALHDGWGLQQMVWLRDLSEAIVSAGRPLEKAAAGTPAQPLAVERATRLFDWTIRNIQLRPGAPEDTHQVAGKTVLVSAPMEPWQVLLTGEGQAIQRAWIFLLLCRQQGLPVVLLAYPDASRPSGLTEWVPALWAENELYLFEPRLGVPIPGPDGQPVATLKQVIAQPELLTNLSLPDDPYPVGPKQLGELIALVEASPVNLSRRMQLLEKQLAGTDTLVLTAAPSALAKLVGKSAGITGVRLWDQPFRTIHHLSTHQQMSPDLVDHINTLALPFVLPVADLWSGRIWHLKGLYTTPELEEEIPGQERTAAQIDERTGRLLRYRTENGANQLYVKVRRDAIEALKRLETGNLSPQERAHLAPLQKYLQTANAAATYWLGLTAYERALEAKTPAEQRELLLVAIDFLERDVLGDEPPSKWQGGARYNLGRCYELLGQPQEALAQYRADTSAGKAASQWRAMQLEKSLPQPERIGT